MKTEEDILWEKILIKTNCFVAEYHRVFGEKLDSNSIKEIFIQELAARRKKMRDDFLGEVSDEELTKLIEKYFIPTPKVEMPKRSTSRGKTS